MAVTTKSAAIQAVVDDLQAFADETGSQSLYWHLGRLDVLATFAVAYPRVTIDAYLIEANEALAAAKEAQG